MFEGIMYMPTLPNAFNSLVGKTVRIETEKPQYIIELLGDLLGVEDYKTNKAAFWFLDAIALQVLRYKNCLDDHYRSVLISWLAGEMKLIRDRKLLREDFFKEMRILFLCVTEKLSSNDRLLHWDEYSKIMSQNPSTDASANNEAEYLITNKLSEKELITKDDKYMSQENKFFFLERELKDHNSSNSAINNLQERSSMNVKTSENLRTDVFANSNTAIGTFNLTNPSDVLDIIVEATYNMYANELRYALIYAVFAQPIQVQIFHMPHTVRLPRQIKLADPGGTFDLQLRERLEKIAESQRINGEKVKGKRKENDS
ncbi:uncharacterized protein LOC105206664 isoform X2 [Solenopsis invicta]|uniref:uncharacterized protein LOC105206664 isoform X2 n=1 Tax=Solenopsis invicta TaxID=13686 RepID=UPI00193DB07F|nr:uncharacterized protein LOC105206664 isoform X2 [Solenopsis invicta]